MKKTLLVSPYPPARDGIATYAAQMAADLRRRGSAVDVVSPEPSAARHHANYRTPLGLLRLLRLARRSDRTVLNFYPELFFPSLRLRFLVRWPMVAGFLASARNVELVVHELPYGSLKRARGLPGLLGRALWRALLSLPRATYVHTEWERRQMAESVGLPPERIAVLEHERSFQKRTQMSQAQARRELGLAEDQFCFLCIGFLQHHKGFDRAVLALRRLPGEHLRLHIVGSARLEAPEIEYYVSELRALVAATPRAELHEGYVSDHAFDSWLVASDVVLLPYRDIWSSGVLARAQLFGRPVVATDVGGLPDQMGGLGRVVHDADELCRAMAEAADVPCQPIVAGEGSEEHQEVLSYEQAVELVRKRASAERGHGEVDVPAEAAGRDRLPHFTLPDPNLGGGARALLKRTIGRLTRWQLAPLVRQLNETRGYLQERFAQDEAARAERAARVDERLNGIAESVADQETRTASAETGLELQRQILTREIEELRGELRRLGQLRGEDRAELTAALARLRAGQPAGTVAASPPAAPAGQGPDLAAFYEAHQERFRGSPESVRQRLEIYVPQIRAAVDAEHPVLDVGPGRGEWLALLKERGIKAYGVDVNPAFVSAGAEAGLDVVLGDGVEHLKGVADGSLGAVTAFHVIEHIPLEALVELADNALRALRPGGVLILETPNPLNVEVGASSFHLDPTHVRPVHPLLLEFLLQNRGFTGVRTVMVNPPWEPPIDVELPPDGRAGPQARMAEVLNKSFFVGLDYAVIGRRADAAPEGAGASVPEPAGADVDTEARPEAVQESPGSR